MGRYEFVSPGGEAVSVLTQMLAKQELDKRQKMLDELNAKNVNSQIEDRKVDNAARLEEIESNKAARAELGKNTALARSVQIADTVPKGAPMTPGLAESLGPLAGSMTQQQGGHMDPAEGQGPTMDSVFTGSQKSNQFDEMQALKAHIADMTNEARQNAQEIQRAVLEGRMNDAQARLALQQQNLDLRERMGALDMTIKGQKAAAAEKEVTDKKTGIKNERQDVRNLIKGIMDDPNLEKAIGPIDGLLPSVIPTTVDLDNRIKRVQSLASLEGRGKLKGSGAISNYEAEQVGSGMQTLNQRTNKDILIKELTRLYNLFEGDTPREAAVAAGVGQKPLSQMTPAEKIAFYRTVGKK